MNRIYVLLFILLLLGGVAYYFSAENDNATIDANESEFAVEDEASIHKIFLADKRGRTATLIRSGRTTWDYVNKEGAAFPARTNAMTNLLKAVTKVSVRYKVSESNMDLAIKNLSTDGIKVEVYDKSNNRLKTYYVGGPTNDQQGTYMIMDNVDNPYVTHLGTWEGVLTPRYMLEEEDWRDRSVFRFKEKDIQSVAIEYPRQKNNSFKLTRSGNDFEVTPFYPSTAAINKPVVQAKVKAYLYNYEKMMAEAFENNNPNKAEIVQRLPFCTITVELTDGTVKKANLIPVIEEVEDRKTGEVVRPKIERFFALINDGEDLMLVQNLVFYKLFLGYDHFF